ncbi:unnamed protein product [Candidula unifasciata]|uniref:Alkaline ceramidase n=1 Tax=Candidula unifasciata TaxID=100452 RepID=A0A8S3YL53_9EUPU|nr:unnamed protein product [Candidula unifasciata]
MPPGTGYWGQQTATIEWCEENYVVSYYVAEFWNTLSNAVIIFSPLVMLILCYTQKYETRFVCTFAAMTVVGIGSVFFHMTLKYNMQLMDELPMVWANASFLYSCLMMTSKSNTDNIILQASLFLGSLAITVVYVLIEVPLFLQIAYGVMNTLVILLHIRMVLTMDCNKYLFLCGLGCYLLGFLLWNIDNVYCHQLRYLRKHTLAESSGMLFECHAWWHVFTGIGAYLGILFTLHTRYVFLQRKPKLKMFLGFWPYVSLPPVTGKIQ